MIYFALAVHNHQPVGNFDEVIEDAYRQAYSPFINLLYQYPNIKLTLHYSGILWEWFVRNHPELIKLLKVMAGRGQVELMSGGFYEPILPVLPDEDKRGQIDKMNSFLKETFGVDPKGYWLAERVWEPHLVKPLAEGGLEYVVVDDSHFHEVGLKQEQLYGYYLSEEDGRSIKIFPGSKHLRYLIPFHPPQETIDYLRSIHNKNGSAIIQMGDDGEKFGVWPGTHHSVYTEGWLERFFNLLEENSDWLKITTYAEYIKQHKPLGNVYLPTASYSEMMEWALPTPLRKKYELAIDSLKNNPACHNCRGFIKGAFWRNFLVKYPESNHMHKKMLYVSRKLRKMDSCRDKEVLENARNELWQAQCNCGYWHGVFGGLYLPHIRKAIYEHLIKSEQLLDSLKCSSYPWLDVEVRDLLFDGSQMVLISNPYLALYFNPDAGGALQEWDYKPLALNLANTLTRYPEPYHDKIRELINNPANDSEGPQSIHNIQSLKCNDLDKYLSYDNYRRSSFIDHFLAPETRLGDFSDSSYLELGDFVQKPYDFQLEKQPQKVLLTMRRQGYVRVAGNNLPVKIEKSALVRAEAAEMDIQYQITNLSDREIELCFGCELNIAPAYPDGTYWKHSGGSGSLTEPAELDNITKLELVIDYIKLNLGFELDLPAEVWSFPLHTVSQAESGYEKIYQGQVFLFKWNIKLAGNGSWSVSIKQATTRSSAYDPLP